MPRHVQDYNFEVAVTYNGHLPERMLSESQCEHYSDKIAETIKKHMQALRDDLEGIARISMLTKVR